MATNVTALGPSLRQGAVDPPAAAEMGRVAAEFESVFLSQILRGMTQGLAGGGTDGDDPFGSMLQDEYAKLISRSGGIGLADSILREMLKMQEDGP
jgi:Rod binding domain-containing protein